MLPSVGEGAAAEATPAVAVGRVESTKWRESQLYCQSAMRRYIWVCQSTPS